MQQHNLFTLLPPQRHSEFTPFPGMRQFLGLMVDMYGAQWLVVVSIAKVAAFGQLTAGVSEAKALIIPAAFRFRCCAGSQTLSGRQTDVQVCPGNHHVTMFNIFQHISTVDAISLENACFAKCVWMNTGMDRL